MAISRNGFQTFVNAQPAPAAAGDFASTNPRMSLPAPDQGYVAVAAGVYVGRFAWGSYALETAANYFSLLARPGFVHREQQGMLVDFLEQDSLLVQGGYPVTLMSRGDFWANFAGGGAIGAKVYADPLTGLATADVTGQSLTTAITASLATTGVLTVTVAAAATLAVGQIITGTGVPAGTYIVNQLTGSAGDTGTYTLSVTGTVLTSRAMVAYGKIETAFTLDSTVLVDTAFTASLAVTGILTISAIGSGVPAPGQFLNATGLPSNVRLVSQLTGTTGSTGTYTVSTGVASPLLTSRAFTGAAGKLGKISTW